MRLRRSGWIWRRAFSKRTARMPLALPPGWSLTVFGTENPTIAIAQRITFFAYLKACASPSTDKVKLVFDLAPFLAERWRGWEAFVNGRRAASPG